MVRMRIAAVLGAALAVAACGGGDDDGYPVRPGGGGGGGGGGGSGSPDGATADASGLLAGHVCVVNDLRQWFGGCDSTADEDLTITIGSASASTDATGNFEIDPPTSAPTMMKVSGPGIVSSNIAYDPSAGELQLTAPTTQAWNDLLDQTGINVPDGSATVFVAIVLDEDDEPAVGAQLGSEPAPDGGDTLYDTDDKDIWVAKALTGNAGKALLAPVPPGVVTFDASVGALAGDDSATAIEGEIVFARLLLE